MIAFIAGLFTYCGEETTKADDPVKKPTVKVDKKKQIAKLKADYKKAMKAYKKVKKNKKSKNKKKKADYKKKLKAYKDAKKAYQKVAPKKKTKKKKGKK